MALPASVAGQKRLHDLIVLFLVLGRHAVINDVDGHRDHGAFHRLRIGIGRPEHGDVRLYVTAPFRKDEMIAMDQLFPKLRAILDSPDKPAEVDING